MNNNEDLEIKTTEKEKVKDNQAIKVKNNLKNKNNKNDIVVVTGIIIVLVVMVAGVVAMMNMDRDMSNIDDFNMQQNRNNSDLNDTETINKEDIGSEGQKSKYSEEDLKTDYDEDRKSTRLNSSH